MQGMRQSVWETPRGLHYAETFWVNDEWYYTEIRYCWQTEKSVGEIRSWDETTKTWTTVLKIPYSELVSVAATPGWKKERLRKGFRTYAETDAKELVKMATNNTKG